MDYSPSFDDIPKKKTSSVEAASNDYEPNFDDIPQESSVMDYGKKLMGEGITAKHQGVGRAILAGLGEGGQNIALALTGGKAPKVNMDEMFGIDKSSAVQKGVKDLSQYAPLLAAGPMGLLADIGVGAGYSALQSPDNKLKGGAIGGGTSGAFNIINKLMGASNPLVRAGSRALLGGAAGYGYGGASGAAEGAAAGVLAPSLLKKLGIGTEHPGVDIASKVLPGEVAGRAEAGERLGTPLTPGEASGRPDITGQEAMVGRVGPAATEKVKIGQQRIQEQKNAIDELYRRISPKDKIASFDVRKAAQDSIEKMKQARQEAVDPLYKIAETKKAAPNLITKLERENPIIGEAIDDVLADKKYQVKGELLGEPRNSIKTLDYAKRKIDSKIEQAKNYGDNDAVRVLTKTKNKLLDSIDGFSPDYKAAREEYSRLSKPIEDVENGHIGMIANMKDTSLKDLSKKIFDPSQTDLKVLNQVKSKIQAENPEAWDLIVKNEMNRLMTQGKNRGITGRNFFDSVLSNDNRFKQFQSALEGNDQALSHLNDMKSAWEHLINIETPRTAAGQSKTSMNKAREAVQAFIDAYNEMMGSDKQIKALNYLYTDKWRKDMNFVSNFKEGKGKKMMMAGLVGKTLVPAYTLEKSDKSGEQ